MNSPHREGTTNEGCENRLSVARGSRLTTGTAGRQVKVHTSFVRLDRSAAMAATVSPPRLAPSRPGKATGD